MYNIMALAITLLLCPVLYECLCLHNYNGTIALWCCLFAAAAAVLLRSRKLLHAGRFDELSAPLFRPAYPPRTTPPYLLPTYFITLSLSYYVSCAFGLLFSDLVAAGCVSYILCSITTAAAVY